MPQTPDLDEIEQCPNIFIAAKHYPFEPWSVDELKARLENHDWKDILAHSTGHYVLFNNSDLGRASARECYRKCHGGILFIYKMNMELQLYPNPNANGGVEAVHSGKGLGGTSDLPMWDQDSTEATSGDTSPPKDELRDERIPVFIPPYLSF